MKTDILTPDDIFRKEIHYIIPPFQRPYVWTQEEQWEPLWEDVRNTVESYLEKLSDCKGNEVEAKSKVPPHFLGAVVSQQISTPTKAISQRQVIDGQQRLTTLQLLLDALRQVCKEFDLEADAEFLSKFVINPDHRVGNNEEHIFKLWPTSRDREAFKHAMDNGSPTNAFENSRIVQAHEYFRSQTREWLKGQSDTGCRTDALTTAIVSLFQLVVIDLDHQEDPHIIFETLNARGTPLLQSELIKNYVMSKTGEATVWGDLGTEWWREEVGRGRRRLPRIDWLLYYWMSMRKAEASAEDAANIPLPRVFSAFQAYSEERPSINDVMSEVKRDLTNYRRFEIDEETTADERQLRNRFEIMQAGAVTPTLLLLLSAPYEQRMKGLHAMESFLVRRMICRYTAKDYNHLTLSLAGELQRRDLNDAGAVVFDFLKRQTADAREWPNDKALEDSLVDLPLYRLLTRGRLRLILEGVEEQLRQESKAECSDVPRGLPIEHVMPQSWDTSKWPISVDSDLETATDERNRLIHTIGNLTLVNNKLNWTMSNDAWASKREILTDHSVLFLNRTLLAETKGRDWDTKSIQARGRRLASIVARVWPGPDSDVWSTNLDSAP